MKAAIVAEAGKPPIYSDFKEPVPTEKDASITVTAAALSHITKAWASGTHYKFIRSTALCCRGGWNWTT